MIVLLLAASRSASSPPPLSGVVTDPTGAVVAGAARHRHLRRHAPGSCCPPPTAPGPTSVPAGQQIGRRPRDGAGIRVGGARRHAACRRRCAFELRPQAHRRVGHRLGRLGDGAAVGREQRHVDRPIRHRGGARDAARRSAPLGAGLQPVPPHHRPRSPIRRRRASRSAACRRRARAARSSWPTTCR